MVPPQTKVFKIRFCERFKCSPAEYEQRAFRKLLYPHAKLIASLIRLVSPGFFAEDFKFIRFLGDASGFRDASVDVLNFGDVNLGNPKLLRTGLKLRISGRKATRLAKILFSENLQAGARDSGRGRPENRQ